MRRFRSILVVPLTNQIEPPPALAEAVALAALSGAETTILGHHRHRASYEPGSDVPAVAALRKGLLFGTSERLKRWADSAGPVKPKVEITVGSLATEVENQIRRHGHDLVVIASDGSADSDVQAASVARAASSSVWVLRPSFTGRRVIAAVDPDHDRGLNQMIIELAASQAQTHGGQMTIVHAWHIAGLDTLGPNGAALMGRDELSAAITAIEDSHRTAFEATLLRCGRAADEQARLIEGPSARAISTFAQRNRADLIVLGSGDTAWLGTTVEQLLAESAQSLLVVKQPWSHLDD